MFNLGASESLSFIEIFITKNCFTNLKFSHFQLMMWLNKLDLVLMNILSFLADYCFPCLIEGSAEKSARVSFTSVTLKLIENK